MTGAITTQVLIPFTSEDATGLGGSQLQLELDPTFAALGLGKRRLKLYPAVNAKVVASVGTVVRGSSEFEEIADEGLLFSGSKTASTRRPVVQLATIVAYGATFDREGNLINPSFSIVDGVVTASEEVYGSVIINYRTSFKQIDYEGEDTSGGQGLSFNLGTVLAFFNGSVAQLTIRPGDFEVDEGTVLYEIISEAVANEDGLFEKPPNWTGQPGSPTFPGGNPNPNNANQLHERVHETGYITEQSSTFTRTQFVPPAKPFVGSGFAEVKKIRVATAGAGGLTQDQLDSGAAQRAIESAQERYKV
jgi:hypothetical protein